MTNENLQLVYTLLCDDVRIEMGNKISLMGVFQNIMVEKLPISLIKFAVVNHWRGAGNHQTEVRILSPNKSNLVVTSQPTQIETQQKQLDEQAEVIRRQQEKLDKQQSEIEALKALVCANNQAAEICREKKP